MYSFGDTGIIHPHIVESLLQGITDVYGPPGQNEDIEQPPYVRENPLE
jgi:hypothetical protein